MTMSRYAGALQVLLESYAFRVVTFSGAAEFLASKHPRTASCLVLDLTLPGMNGLVLQETMTALGLAIPIIFISGQGDIPRSVKAMKRGAVDFLPKPFTDRELLEAIDRAVAENRNPEPGPGRAGPHLAGASGPSPRGSWRSFAWWRTGC